jgi:hypothetical protein
MPHRLASGRSDSVAAGCDRPSGDRNVPCGVDIRSWLSPQPWQVHSRTPGGSASSRCPHRERVLPEGYQRSTAVTVRPYPSASYSSMVRKSDQLVNAVCRRRRPRTSAVDTSHSPTVLPVEIETACPLRTRPFLAYSGSAPPRSEVRGIRRLELR